jgi:hypothetical protein
MEPLYLEDTPRDSFGEANHVRLNLVGSRRPEQLCSDVFLNKTYVESTFKIVTGFIEPHLYADFSGGPVLGKHSVSRPQALRFTETSQHR